VYLFSRKILFLENLEFLERGDMVKDYSLNPTATAESEDDEDPRTPTSISSQGSQGYDSSASLCIWQSTFLAYFLPSFFCCTFLPPFFAYFLSAFLSAQYKSLFECFFWVCSTNDVFFFESLLGQHAAVKKWNWDTNILFALESRQVVVSSGLTVNVNTVGDPHGCNEAPVIKLTILFQQCHSGIALKK